MGPVILKLLSLRIAQAVRTSFSKLQFKVKVHIDWPRLGSVPTGQAEVWGQEVGYKELQERLFQETRNSLSIRRGY